MEEKIKDGGIRICNVKWTVVNALILPALISVEVIIVGNNLDITRYKKFLIFTMISTK